MDTPPAFDDAENLDIPAKDDKPFDDTPFDAGVEASEENEPKKFIQQLSGKLGQSLRKYTKEQGQPDFELEKFAINSVISATNTANMDVSDQNDIIDKIKSAGAGEKNGNAETEAPIEEPKEDLPNDEELGDELTPDDSSIKESKGLWANIHAKRERGETAAKPGDENYPDKKQWDKLTKENEEGDSKNYMFWQNLKTIKGAIEDMLKMNQSEVDAILSNGHGWALDHIATSADDIEEVYHFLEGNGEKEDISDEEYGSVETISEAEYKGKNIELNKPTRGDVKKYKVYVKNDKGNIVKVNFGDKNMEIKRDNPERRKSFRARHKCENPGPKWKAKYWSCKFWSTESVSDLLGENLEISENSDIFVDKSKLEEMFNKCLCDILTPTDTVDVNQTEATETLQPEVKPDVKPTPVKTPRRSKPWKIKPGEAPKPKAEA